MRRAEIGASQNSGGSGSQPPVAFSPGAIQADDLRPANASRLAIEVSIEPPAFGRKKGWAVWIRLIIELTTEGRDVKRKV
jgi:hypothetical protein